MKKENENFFCVLFLESIKSEMKMVEIKYLNREKSVEIKLRFSSTFLFWLFVKWFKFWNTLELDTTLKTTKYWKKNKIIWI